MKIAGIGLHKTGTTTLGVCLRHWKLRHVSNSKSAFGLFLAEGTDAALRILEQYDSCEDLPWALMYKEIDARFADARFVLTKRRNSDIWFSSVCSHAERTGPTLYREFIYGHAMPHRHKEAYIRRYEEHNASVEAHFEARRDKLLVVCWEDGDGWERLGHFLQLQTPDIPFPHANKKCGPKLYEIKRTLRRAIGRHRYASLSNFKLSCARIFWSTVRW